MKAHLTPFQIATEAKLLEIIASRDITPVMHRVEGATEPVVKVVIDSLQLWIYVDGACIIGDSVDRVLEKWDFDSLDALRDEFLSIVRAQMPAKG